MALEGTAISAIRDTVPISLFNKGQAAKIFEAARRDGVKVVLKNNAAEAVVMSPQQYVDLIEELEDLRLEQVALRRMEDFDESDTLTQAEVMEEYGITEADLQAADDVEFE